MRLISSLLIAAAIPLLFAADPRPWLRENAVPLRSAQPGQGFADMQPLKKMVGDARIVSLGEATHGSREFFQLKHRMLEFLATEMGFTIFSIEANMPEAYRLNEYVLTGKGDPAALLKGLYFWTWDTEEVLAMIQWMRAFNSSGKGRVEFTGFDMQTPDVAMKNVAGFVAQRDSSYAAKLKEAVALVGSPQQSQRNFGVVTFSSPAKGLAGKKVRYSGFIRTASVQGGQAHLWFRADHQGAVKVFRNLGLGGVTGTSDWQKYSVEVDVPADADLIVFGGTASGSGTAWFDELTLEVDGERHAVANAGFEGALQQGYYAGGNGTSVQLDETVFQGGKQSVRLTRPVATGAPEPNVLQAVSSWKQVVQHMEGERTAYREAGAAAPAIEWAIQNARVVRQCLEMRAGMVPRDESMARNVEWILEQSPTAKIVLWAHNGHVATTGFRGYQPMGATLRKTYGDRMVVFGFSFQQGSFQAVKQGDRLQDFTVPPAPEGTWDALMATAGAPVFALDLRNAPVELRQPMKTRNIGALYSNENAERYYSETSMPEAYDALLFVESTTAARKNKQASIFAKSGDGAWRDAETGVQFTLTEGWSIAKDFRWGTGETTVQLTDAGASSTRAALYYRIEKSATPRTPEAAEKSLLGGLESKVAQRQREGLPDYRERPDSRRRHDVNGHPAISWVAEFSTAGQPMVEVCTYIQSERVTALFFTKLPSAGLEAFQERLAPVVESLRIP